MNEKYLPSNLVYSLAIYDWSTQLGIVGIGGLFERLKNLLGSEPDDVWLCPPGTWKGKDYKYGNFVKRNVIHQKNWQCLSYHWRRQADARAYFAIELNVNLDQHPQLAVHIDEAAVTHADETYQQVIAAVCEALEPLYGIGFSVPYSWSPAQFVAGQGSGYTGPETGLEYDSAEAFCIRGINAGQVLLKQPSPLDEQIRDVFEINLLSINHLRHPIEGKTLESWIVTQGKGQLRKIANSTWRWDIEKKQLPSIRRSAISAGLIVDPFWIDLDWIDG